MTSTKSNLLLELLEEAKTPEDVATIEQMWIEEQGGMAKNTYLLRTLTEVAEFFGLDEHTIRTWRLRSPKMPGEPGKWPIKDIVRWRCDWLGQTDLMAAKKHQEYELGQIQVESKRIELEKEKGNILERSDVELWAATALVELRESIMQLKEILAAGTPEELKNFVRVETDRHCRDTLTATARRLEAIPIGENNESK